MRYIRYIFTATAPYGKRNDGDRTAELGKDKNKRIAHFDTNPKPVFHLELLSSTALLHAASADRKPQALISLLQLGCPDFWV